MPHSPLHKQQRRKNLTWAAILVVMMLTFFVLAFLRMSGAAFHG